jgi:hypothetical protein
MDPDKRLTTLPGLSEYQVVEVQGSQAWPGFMSVHLRICYGDLILVDEVILPNLGLDAVATVSPNPKIRTIAQPNYHQYQIFLYDATKQHWSFLACDNGR